MDHNTLLVAVSCGTLLLTLISLIVNLQTRASIAESESRLRTWSMDTFVTRHECDRLHQANADRISDIEAG